MLRATLAAQGGSCGSALHAKPASRPPRMPTAVNAPRRRLLAAPPTAIEPASLFVAYQAQQFGLTLIGIGAVAAIAAAAHLARQRDYSQAADASSFTGPTAGAPIPAAVRDAPAADLLVATMVAAQHAAAAPATAYAAPATAAPTPVPVAAMAATLSMGDIRAELQQAAAAAVQAVKTAAEGSPAKAPSRASAIQRATPNGSAVMPGMTVQEATRQVQDWISAWRTDDEAEGQDSIPQGATSHSSSSAPPHSVPSMPSTSASAVLAEMTADAPVAATQVGAEALDPSLTIGQVTGKVGAAQQAASAPHGEEHSAVSAPAAKKEAAAASRSEAAAAAGTKAKIEGLWANYEQKKAKEAELLAKSDRILQNMAEAEAQEQAQQKSMAVATSQQQPQSVAVVLVSRLVTLLQAVQQFVQQLLAKLTGCGGSSNGGAAAGASA